MPGGDEKRAKRTAPESSEDFDADIAAMESDLKGKPSNSRDTLILSMARMIKETNMFLKEIAPKLQEIIDLKDDVKALKDEVSALTTLKEEVKALKDEVLGLKSERKDYKDKLIKMEFEQVSNSVIIRKLPRHPDSANKDFETFSQTESQVMELLSTARVADEVKIVDAVRFAPSKDPEKAKKGNATPIKLTLGDKRQVFKLYSGLRYLKNTAFHNVGIQREVPGSLRKLNELLESTAAARRKANPKCKTKIVQSGSTLKLLFKAENDPKFSEIIPEILIQ